MIDRKIWYLGYTFTWRFVLLMCIGIFLYVPLVEYIKIKMGQGWGFQIVNSVLGFFFMWYLFVLTLKWIIKKGIISSKA